MKIRAAICDAYHAPLHIEDDVELIEPRAREVRVKIVSAGVCHTDMAFQNNEWNLPLTLPMILGHEGAGIVESVGPGVTKVKPGDHVCLTIPYCGECESCRRGMPWYCEHINTLNLSGKDYFGTNPFTWRGAPLSTCLGQGSFAEYCVQHENNVVKIPDDVDLKIAGPLGCGFRTGAGAVYNLLRPRVSEWVAVFGTGNVGMAAIWMAKAMGAKTIAVDVRDNRLEMAKELGADYTYNSAGQDQYEIAAGIKAIADGRGVNYVAESTGVPLCNKAGMLCMKNGGLLAQIATVNAIEFPKGYTKEVNDTKRICFVRMGNVTGEEIIPVLIDMYKRGMFPMDKIVTYYPFEQVNQAMEDSLTGKSFKPILYFD